MPVLPVELTIDRTSFWYGFIAGAIFLLFLFLIRPFLGKVWQFLFVKVQDLRENLTTSAEARFRKEMILLAQRQHLAAPLFSLDEVVLLPRLLAIPARYDPDDTSGTVDETDLQLPYLPDWPLLSAHYAGETISLVKALSGGANLALLGGAGSGKTVALAFLACQFARRDPSIPKGNQLLPVLVHVSDLLPAGQYPGQPLQLLVHALQLRSPSLETVRLEELLRTFFLRGKALLLLDGLDEQSPAIHGETVRFLDGLLQSFPGARTIVVANPENFSGLTGLGLAPVALAAWSQHRQQEFLIRWGTNWRRFIDPPAGETVLPDPAILNSWLLFGSNFPTPLELTLKAWAAYAGDAVGPSPIDAMQAFIQRMTLGLPKARPALESLALQMVVTLHPTLTAKEARKWTGETDRTAEISAEDQSSENGREPSSISGVPRAANLRGMVSDLVEIGLLVNHAEGRLSFAHPSITAFLAAAAVAKNGLTQTLATQPEWSGKTLTIGWLAALVDITPIIEKSLDGGPDPLLRGLFTAARWLPQVSKEIRWRGDVLRFLVDVLRSEDLVFNQRASALAALVYSGDTGLAVLFHQMLSQAGVDGRSLAALGAGFMNDTQVTAALSEALEDPSAKVTWAASLALATIGTQPALESLAFTLLHGEDSARRSAAEALALNPGEGHAALQEGSSVEDLLVRRAVVFGLAKVEEPWARQILEKMAVDDKEWVVRAAASLALEEIHQSRTAVPTPLCDLSELPWLIEFAGERGLGIAPGKAATQLLLTALQTGNPAQRLAALEILERMDEPLALPVIYALVAGGDPELGPAAYQTLWHLLGAGVETRKTAETSQQAGNPG